MGSCEELDKLMGGQQHSFETTLRAAVKGNEIKSGMLDRVNVWLTKNGLLAAKSSGSLPKKPTGKPARTSTKGAREKPKPKEAETCKRRLRRPKVINDAPAIGKRIRVNPDAYAVGRYNQNDEGEIVSHA